MWLRIQYPSALVLLFARYGSTLPLDASATCKMLTDNDSPLLQSIASLSGIPTEEYLAFPVDKVFAPVNQVVPWFSQCVANIDPLAIIPTLSSNEAFNNCLSNLETAQEPSGSSGSEFADFLCPGLTKAIIPCINNAFVPILASAMDATNGCCDDMKEVITSTFGTDLSTTIESLSKSVTNALCAVKSYQREWSNSSTTEACGDSFIDQFASDDIMTLVSKFLAAMQIPNDGVCAAINSSPFLLTTGATAQLGSPGVEPYGVCFSPISDLITLISRLPIIQTTYIHTASDLPQALEPLSDLFSDGTCIWGDYLSRALLDDHSFLMQLTNMMDDIEAALERLAPPPDAPAEGEYKPENLTTNEIPGYPPQGSLDNIDQNDTASSAWADLSIGFKDTLEYIWPPVPSSSSSSSRTDENSTATFTFSGRWRRLASQYVMQTSDGDGGEEIGNPNITTIMKAMLINLAEPLSYMCFHFPNSVSCSFGVDSVTLPYPEVVPTTTNFAPENSSE